MRWDVRGPGYFFEPTWAIIYPIRSAERRLGRSEHPHRIAPLCELDTGLVFEREPGAQEQRTLTLEPRLMYSYMPYRNQNELPIFDTGMPDLNMVELFRINRYVGDDRIGDANQLAYGLTSRLFNQNTGTQYLSATFGQIRYFTQPRVLLPSQITQTCRARRS